MGDSDKFVLRWNDFEKNIVGAYKDLRSDKNFQDVSLVCQGGNFSAHRVILSACSPVFLEMIRGVASQDMAALLDFMYHGETNVAEADLERFLAVAEDLEVRGLTGGETTEGPDQSRRDQDVDLDTAVDDDVNSLLAGLDDQPAPKRVKQERHEAGQQQQAGGFTITTSSGVQPAAAVQEKIRVKAEQRVRVSLPSSLPSYTPPQGVTLTRPALTASSSDQLRNLLASSSSSSSSSLQSQPVPSPRFPPAPVRHPLTPPVPVVRPGPAQPRLVSSASLPANPLLYPGQPLLPPDIGRLQVEQTKDGSPPVLHLPDNYGNFMLDPNMPGMPAGSEDLEYQRKIEAFIERGESKLSCKSCDKTVNTKNKQNLVAHIESVHLKAEIQCGSCQKTFKATSYLKQHQKRSGCT